MTASHRKSSTLSKVIPPSKSQLDLFGTPPTAPALLAKTAAESGRRFVTGDARTIFIGPTRLEEYLKQAGQSAPFTVANLLDQEDWRQFEARYAAIGRAPYAPRAMLGLILFGIMQGHHSLRELERFARLDLGCMWITGGIAPDHANIGRFIVMHETTLTQDFFESLTRRILKATGSSNQRLAGDGTVIEAACSHYKLLKQEALQKKVEDAQRKYEKDPDDPDSKHEVEITKQCLDVYEQRAQACKRSGRPTENLRISPTEPDAMVQRLKRGKGHSASYKPSVFANESRIVTAIAVDASSETKVIGAMLDQSVRVTGVNVQELLLDGGYFDDSVIAATLERDVSLLCPDGQELEKSKAGKGGRYPKSSFEYDASRNTYRCPAGQTLTMVRFFGGSEKTREFKMYAANACGDCTSRDKCTTARRREIKRHAEDEQRDALRAVMRQPQVRSVFAKRKAMVEPVFSHLREQQGLNRFRRRGLAGVTREFGLHVLAYNLARAVALLKGLFVAISGSQTPFPPSKHTFRRLLTKISNVLRYSDFNSKIEVRLVLS